MKNEIGCFGRTLLMLAYLGFLIGYAISDLNYIVGIIGALCGILLTLGINRVIYPQKSKINEKVLVAICKFSMLVMKADDCITTSELYVFRDYMLENFGSNVTGEAIEIMKDLQYQKISSSKAASVINARLNYSEKMQILQFLFKLAAANGEMPQAEQKILNQIAEEMQILQTDFIHLKNAYNYMYNRRYSQQDNSNQNNYSVRKTDPMESDYAILGVKNTDSNEEIKAAYRRLALANHPDKVQHLGEVAHLEAEKRFSKINESYNKIKKIRKL
jgi:DnaJ like chaperone protein